MPQITVREILHRDIPAIINYWMNADEAFLRSMGADIHLLPNRTQWEEMLNMQLQLAYPEKLSYATIWLLNNKAVGHCNVNMIEYGKQANMHLHLWQTEFRQKGLGLAFVKRSLPLFFENLKLQTLYCEPYALNPAPNKTLEKLGFKFEKEYITTPGSINFEQPVNRWSLTVEDFKKIL
ncbi:MAG: GNAT family protein [Bacteroidota bacterium]